MEMLTGKVVGKAETESVEPVKEVELFTNPVAVHRIKLNFGAVPIVQTVLTAVCCGILRYKKNNGGEIQAVAEEIIRRIVGG